MTGGKCTTFACRRLAVFQYEELPMPLPSQYARPQSRTTHMYRRRRPKRALMGVLLLALLAVTLGVWVWIRSDTPQQSVADSSVAIDNQLDAFAASEYESGGGLADRSFSPPASAPPVNSDPQRVTMGQRVPLQPTAQQTLPQPSGQQAATPPADRQDSSSTPSHTSPAPTQSEPKPETRTPAPSPAPSNQRVADRLRSGMDLLAANKPIEARRVLTQALLTPGIDRRTAQGIRETLTELNERLVFSREIVPDDPYSFGYAIRPGDTLGRIATRENTHIDWRFIQRINGITRPQAIQAGQRLKLVQGPFHAVVVKQDYRLDLFLGEGSDRVYVRSFPVGLGEHDSTPLGRFRVRQNSKLINPAWTNPRTGEHFAADDPNNPIGERWIGLEGMTEAVRDLAGYGIHGTIEPDSIGRQESMGCIRLRSEDVELLYEMLIERESTVEIVER
jgi:LysM repeat protein